MPGALRMIASVYAFADASFDPATGKLTYPEDLLPENPPV
jgi:hypothetical protein